MACYSLLTTTVALDNLGRYKMTNLTEDFRESEFLMAGKSVSTFSKAKAALWNFGITSIVVVAATAFAYPAEVKWRRILVSIDDLNGRSLV